MYPKITFVYDRRKRASSQHRGSLEIRITHNYKQKWISTGIMLYPHQWKNGKIVNCPDALQISQTLDILLQKIRKVIVDMMEKGHVDITSISKDIENLKQSEWTFIEFCKQRAIIRKYGKKKDTQNRYDRFIRTFNEWGKIQNYEDIREENILLYDLYLTNKGMKPYSKWNNYHRFLNSFIIDAINDGHLIRNPYMWINIKKEKGSHGLEKCLTPEEFIKIKNVVLPTEKLYKVRDVFVFQTYTCLSYADLKEFDPGAIQEVKGMKVYIGCRHKTNRTFTIPLLSPALDIIYKYEGRLPIISNEKYNEYLKIVAQAAGIDKPLSTHWARHTGATMLLNEGIDMRIVSKICGHASTKITEQVYAKLLDETVVDAISKLEK